LKKYIYKILFKLIPAINRLFKKDQDYKNKKLLIYYCCDFSLSGGLTDRLKGIISAYQISNITKRNFQIICNKPFSMINVLHENKIKWHTNQKELQKKNLWMAKHYNLIDLTNKTLIKKSIQKISNDKSNIIALKINQDYSTILNQYSQNSLEWNEYFDHLFHLSPFTKESISSYSKKYNWNQVIGIHCRFINLLGDNIEHGKVLSKNKQIKIIQKIISNLEKILIKNINHKILVCSDSNHFLSVIKENPQLQKNIIVIEGTPKHSEKNDIDSMDLKKIIQDFFILGECKEINSIIFDGMYPSAFPKYAAKLKNKPFNIIT
tara:strand:+ start:168 stop:1130 length:963 start_codon:yes stop_codon:yes gene_type:complete